MTDATGFEIVEHTADVGLRAWGPEMREAIRQATLALLDITGAGAESGEEVHEIEVTGRDAAGVMVEWLSEVLYIQDGLDRVIAGVEVDDAGPGHAAGRVTTAPRGHDIEGTAVKAITYHQLSLERGPDGWIATVYVDI